MSILPAQTIRKLAFLPWQLWHEGRNYWYNVLVTTSSIAIYLLVYGTIATLLISPFIDTYMWWLAVAVAIVISIIAKNKISHNIDTKFWKIILAVCLIYSFAKPIGVYLISNRSFVATIRDSERVIDNVNGNHYRLETSIDTYKITDSNWFIQWKSSNLHGYAKANIGQSCLIRVYGMRVAYLSIFPTVVSINCEK